MFLNFLLHCKAFTLLIQIFQFYANCEEKKVYKLTRFFQNTVQILVPVQIITFSLHLMTLTSKVMSKFSEVFSAHVWEETVYHYLGIQTCSLVQIWLLTAPWRIHFSNIDIIYTIFNMLALFMAQKRFIWLLKICTTSNKIACIDI